MMPLQTIPGIAHFIWMGGPLPLAYLQNIKSCHSAMDKKQHKIIVWVDKKANFYNSIEKNYPGLKLDEGIEVRTIGDLFAEMKKHEFFTKERPHQDFVGWKRPGTLLEHIEKYVALETSGLRNFAAASDILRAVVLYLNGGYYFDTDTLFGDPKNPRKALVFTPETTEFGVKMVHDNNDMLGAVKQSDFFEQLIIEMLNRYELLQRIPSNTLPEKKKFRPTQMDAKRQYSLFYKSTQGNEENTSEDRRAATMRTTGPGVFHTVFAEYVNQKLPQVIIDNVQKMQTDLNRLKVMWNRNDAQAILCNYFVLAIRGRQMIGAAEASPSEVDAESMALLMKLKAALDQSDALVATCRAISPADVAEIKTLVGPMARKSWEDKMYFPYVNYSSEQQVNSSLAAGMQVTSGADATWLGNTKYSTLSDSKTDIGNMLYAWYCSIADDLSLLDSIKGTADSGDLLKELNLGEGKLSDEKLEQFFSQFGSLVQLLGTFLDQGYQLAEQSTQYTESEQRYLLTMLRIYKNEPVLFGDIVSRAEGNSFDQKIKRVMNAVAGFSLIREQPAQEAPAGPTRFN